MQTFYAEYLNIGCNEHNLHRYSVIFAVPLTFIFCLDGQPAINFNDAIHDFFVEYDHLVICGFGIFF